MEKIVSISEKECVNRWGWGMYVYLFYNLVVFDKEIRDISLGEDSALRFDLMYGWHGDNY